MGFEGVTFRSRPMREENWLGCRPYECCKSRYRTGCVGCQFVTLRPTNLRSCVRIEKSPRQFAGGFAEQSALRMSDADKLLRDPRHQAVELQWCVSRRKTDTIHSGLCDGCVIELFIGNFNVTNAKAVGLVDERAL